MEILKKLRLKNNITQREVSEKAGYSCAQYIYNAEKGISYPSPKMAVTMAKLYKVSYKELVNMIIDDKLEKMRKKLLKKYNIS